MPAPAGKVWSDEARHHFWTVVRTHRLVVLEGSQPAIRGLLWVEASAPHVMYNWDVVCKGILSERDASEVSAIDAMQRADQQRCTALFSFRFPSGGPVFEIGKFL